MLSRLLGGSPFNGKLSTRTQIWTSISTSQATKRQKNIFLRSTLKSLVLLPWLIPRLRRLFLLTSELLCLCLPDVGFIYLFLSGLGPEICVALPKHIYIYIYILYRLRSHCSIVTFIHDLYGPD